MVKLAEPRVKKRYNLVPRGKALYEDESRFGTKMLEKMGWTKGKGLGARGEGSNDFVHVRYKNDAEGFGYEARDDQWTQHQESFDGLLKSLTENNKSKVSDEDSDVENRNFGLGFTQTVKKDEAKSFRDNISGQSLEERSKQSRARVHYKKFTRGKDLARYSEKDLANIFGKKSLDDNTKAVESELKDLQKSETEEEHFKSSTLSVNDYFKHKMDPLKKKQMKRKMNENELNAENEISTLKAEEIEGATEEMLEMKKMKNKKEVDIDVDVEIEEQTKETKKRKKKHIKKEKRAMECQEEKAVKEEEKEDITEVEVIPKEVNDSMHTGAKNKRKAQKVAEVDIVQQTNSTNEEMPKRKSKKLKKEKQAEVTKTTPNESDKKLVDEIMKTLHHNQVYEISKFVAEQFRFADVSSFKGSNLPDLKGYSIPANVKLQVVNIASDEKRVLQLWSSAVTKYELAHKSMNPYLHYVQLARAARTNNEKLPSFKTQKYSRKNAFKIVTI